MSGWSCHWLLLALLKKQKSFWRQRWREITNWSAGGHLLPGAKKWTAILPGVLGTTAALSHYSALPQRSDGGWDGAEPHTGHRGCNKSQMCWGDMKIHGQAPLSAFKYEYAHMYVHAQTHTQNVEIFEECRHRDGKKYFFVILIVGIMERWKQLVIIMCLLHSSVKWSVYF